MIHARKRLSRCALMAAVVLAPGLVLAENLVIPGAGPPEALLLALAREFNNRQARHRVDIPQSTGRAGALHAVRSGATPLGRAGATLTDAERREGIRELAFARDAIVFAVGWEVPLRGLSEAQLADIFSGKFNNWRELGGPSFPIRVVAREETAQTLQLIRQSLPRFKDLKFPRSAALVSSETDVRLQLDRFGAAISWLSRTNLALAKTAIRDLTIDGVAASPENVAANRYPLVMTYYLFHGKDGLTGAAREFVDFLFSPSGENIMRARGALPLAR